MAKLAGLFEMREKAHLLLCASESPKSFDDIRQRVSDQERALLQTLRGGRAAELIDCNATGELGSVSILARYYEVLDREIAESTPACADQAADLMAWAEHHYPEKTTEALLALLVATLSHRT